MSKEKIKTVLAKYLPERAVDGCAEWIIQKNIHLKITRERASKFGDYRPLPGNRGHKITVNHDLNPFAFLITFVHEVAHLETHLKYNRRHDPHGKEWKQEFRRLLHEFVAGEIFPEDISRALVKYLLNPAASSCTDHNLMRALRKHDKQQDRVSHLEELSANSIFTMHQSKSKLVFQKGPKIRTRFQCLEINTNKIYLVSPLAEVVKINS